MNYINRLHGLATALFFALLLLGFLLSMHHLQHALLIYLASWLFVLAISLGSMSLLLIHGLTGGEWGEHLRVHLRAAVCVLSYLAVAATPLLLGMYRLFPWLQPGVIDPDMQRQHWYLNAIGLVLRTVVCLAFWYWLARMLTRRATSRIRTGNAAVSLIAMFVTVSMLAVDWVMSLVPRWHSTDIGLLVFSSQLLIAFAWAVLWQSMAYINSENAVPPRLRRDYGSLLLAMVLGWAYVSFMDYLTAWIADMPSETVWYLPRFSSPWWMAGVALMVLGLAVPFFTLLSARAKSSWRVLAVITAVTLFAQGINAAWLILPSVVAQDASLGWGDPFLCAGLLGICATRYRALLMVEDFNREPRTP